MKAYISIVKGITVGVLIAITNTATAQMSQYKFEQIFRMAFQEMVSGNYEGAKPMFEVLNSSDPQHAQVQYLLALCQVNTGSQNRGTLELLQKAVSNYNYYHEHGNVNDRTAPAKAWYLLAELNAQFNRSDKAVEAYRNYISCIPLATKEHKRSVIDKIHELRSLESGSINEHGVSILATLQP